MARHEAIVRVCETVIGLLERIHRTDGFDPPFAFSLYVPKNSSQNPPMRPTIFLSPYRILANPNFRIPSERLMKDGKRQMAQLKCDLHFLLTIWSDSAQTELLATGWLMRAMGDNPILPANLLNGEGASIFQADEAVGLSLGELSIQDMVQLWESLTDSKYHLSIPYVARNIGIESVAIEEV
jgi:hypothetical protein